MRSRIYIKFIIVYLIFAFVSFFTIAAMTSEPVISILTKDRAEDLHREAAVISSDYLQSYYDQSVDTATLKRQLESFSSYLKSSIWLVSFNGTVLISSGNSYTSTPPKTISGFDPAATNNTGYLSGNFYGIFSEDVLTVSAPITVGFETKGYVLIHMPLTRITSVQHSISDVIFYTYIVIFILSLSILAAYAFFVDRPLRKIMKAAKEYSAGNLSYEIPLNTNDEIGYLAAALNDMSSQLNEIEDYQKKFIANVSHDFRSPLTSIKGYVEAISDGTIPPENMDKYLKIILFETDRLTDLTKDLLTLSDFDIKGIMLNMTDFDINEVIKTTAAAFEGTCTGKKVKIELLFADYSTMIHADRGKIQQVLYNLLDNAIKFSEYDSVITIETTIQGNKLLVSVKDHGCGISKTSLPKIWDRFYKSDQSRGKDKKGTGLGLAIVKEIVQAHNENINVISTEGVGTEFIFTLALAKQHSQTS